ncbi:UvrD-helicase domain-containing protein, partial [Rubrivirga sp.]|uniref:UvrD-helicase domain-containing protein n=1 Tax=Rubrivirga sp. TaxID=1885344 RepID=UPI003C711D7C
MSQGGLFDDMASDVPTSRSKAEDSFSRSNVDPETSSRSHPAVTPSRPTGDSGPSSRSSDASDASPPTPPHPAVIPAEAGIQSDDSDASVRARASQGGKAPQQGDPSPRVRPRGRDLEDAVAPPTEASSDAPESGEDGALTLDPRVRGDDVGGDTRSSSRPSTMPTASKPDDVPPFEYWATPVEPGRTLVEASAGTGKTFAIAGLVLRLVLEGDWLGAVPDLRRLLVVTFTKAATEELRTRIRAALRAALEVARGNAEPDDLTRPLGPLLEKSGAPGRLLAALDRVDEAGIFTIHGFCKRVLEQAAFESGTPFEMDFVEDADSDALRRRASADAWARLTHGDPTLT